MLEDVNLLFFLDGLLEDGSQVYFLSDAVFAEVEPF